jgi:hypothetical protein
MGHDIKSDFKDFEDALHHFAALKSGFVHAIITRDVKDYVKSEIGVLTPENYLKTITGFNP